MIIDGHTTSHIAWMIVDIILFLVVAGLEATELLACAICHCLDCCLQYLKPAIWRFVFYLVLNFCWGSGAIGYIWWLPGVCCLIMCILYGYLAFCEGGSFHVNTKN